MYVIPKISLSQWYEKESAPEINEWNPMSDIYKPINKDILDKDNRADLADNDRIVHNGNRLLILFYFKPR